VIKEGEEALMISLEIQRLERKVSRALGFNLLIS